jgi:hypothetical protein
MSQIFHRSTNTLSRATIFGAVFVIAALAWIAFEIQGSPYVTLAGVRKPQPVPFSHQHHVTGLGIDCRYCHTSVSAGIVANGVVFELPPRAGKEPPSARSGIQHALSAADGRRPCCGRRTELYGSNRFRIGVAEEVQRPQRERHYQLQHMPPLGRTYENLSS